MGRIARFAAAVSLALGFAAAATAQAPPTPTPVPPSQLSTEEKIRQLERLLADTRAELEKLKASSSSAETNAKLEELSRRIDILAQEIQNMKMGEAAPTLEAGATAGEKTAEQYGVGPAAARVYGIKKGLSIGGYGEILYSNPASKDQSGAPSNAQDSITDLRAVVYIGYKFDQHFVLNSEIEYENAVVSSDDKGEAEVEFAYIDYTNSPAFNARAGLLLIPSGLVNQLHEPTAFLGARRPDVDQRHHPDHLARDRRRLLRHVRTRLVPDLRDQRPERGRLHRRRRHPRRLAGGVRRTGPELGLRRPSGLHGDHRPSRRSLGLLGRRRARGSSRRRARRSAR